MIKPSILFSIIYLVCLLAVLLGCSMDPQNAMIQPTKLTCEYLENPPVVDIPHPRLAWINVADEGIRGQSQTAWQVRVASTLKGLDQPDFWDSGKIKSSQSNRIAYQGKALTSRQECWWQVRTWDSQDRVSAWSEPAQWRMGLLHPNEWKAQWIGAPWQGEDALPKPQGGPNARPAHFGPPAPLLRKSFLIEKEIEQAVAFVTGLGYFEFYVNGERAGDDVLVPNQTNYGKRPQLPEALINLEDNFKAYKVMYLAYDITSNLNSGENVLGGILGNGFYNPAKFWTAGYGSPRFLAQVYITYKDGTEEMITSDTSWKASRSAILMDMVYYGEVYDARKEQPGWHQPGFDDTNWENVVLRKAPEGKLVAHTAHTDKVTMEIAPVSIEKMENGNYLVDFGVEISGWVRLNNVSGPPGHRIEINFNANLYSGDNAYIFRGDGPESYSPRFNWFVFSGVEIVNWPGELTTDQITAQAVNTYIEESAHFETSNDLLNDINKIWKRSQLDNMHGGLASDCPHRERSGYTGDGQVACVTVMHNYDAKNFYHKWVQDMLEAQNPETGYVPNGAPWQPGCGGGVAWGAAICIIPWEYYVHYGSLDMLQDNYVGMQEYIRYMQTWVDDDGIMYSQRTASDGKPLKWFNLGEWVAPGETMPDAMVHTFYFWQCLEIAANTARALNDEPNMEKYRAMAERTKQAFHKRFYNVASGNFGNGGGDILALEMGVAAGQYQSVLASLKENIRANDGHLDTGIFGTRFFFEVLSENGMHDLAYKVMNKRTEPSFGHWIELGATTSRERWDEGGSHNHPMFGGGIAWLYRHLAGMQADPLQPGYRHIVFKPQIVDDLDFVTYTNLTPLGEAGITWRKSAGALTIDIKVPVSASASLEVSGANVRSIMEGDMPVEKSPFVSVKSADTSRLILNVPSGEYRFTYDLN